MTRAELSRTTVCLPWFSQSEIDAFRGNPTGIGRGGQFWGLRMLASQRRHLVGGFVGPSELWGASQSFGDRMDLCAQMMRTAPAANLMAMMVPKSQARAFLKNGNCGDFEVASDLRFSQLEVGPQFVMPKIFMNLPEPYSSMLQTWNVVSKFLSATVEYQNLERRYLGTETTCSTSDADPSGMTLTQQAGVATHRVHSSAVSIDI